MKTIKTYCYGNLHEFKTLHAAKAFYLEGMNACEGAERDRYVEVYSKLMSGIEPFCDCDGVPAPKKDNGKKALTTKQIERANEIVREKRNADSILDALRAKLDFLENEFKKQNADLISEIYKYADLRNDLAIELIKYEKLGFKA